jgi:ketosteroid isomerase-like protein
MASANVELVRSIFAAWERGDFSSVEWAHPEVEFVIADGPAPGTWRGLARMAEAFRDWVTGWKDFRAIADDFYELDEERVLVLSHGSGHSRTTDIELEQIAIRGGANLFHVQGGKVTKTAIYYDRERAFADLGVDPDVDVSSA